MKDYELNSLDNASKCRAMKAIIKKEAEYYEQHETVIFTNKDSATKFVHIETPMIRKFK